MDMGQAFEGLRLIAKQCWQTSDDKGWHQEKKVYANLKIALGAIPGLIGDRPGAVELLTQAIEPALGVMGGERTKGVPVMSKLMLICTEVAEAAEVFRNAKLFQRLDTCYEAGDEKGTYFLDYVDREQRPAKPEGFGSELADIVIRVFDLAEDLGIDLAAEIKRKMHFNESRAYRHGGKVA